MKGTGLMHPMDILSSPDYVQSIPLSTAGVMVEFDTPTGARYVAFSCNVDFFVGYGLNAAALPSTKATTGGACELNPTVRNIGGTAGTTGINVISRSTGDLTLSWFT